LLRISLAPKLEHDGFRVGLEEDFRPLFAHRTPGLLVPDALVETWGAKCEKAVECLSKDRDALLVFYDFPAEHWKHLRTTNVIESSFATIRHRTVRSKGCLSNQTALAMIFKLGGRRTKLASPQRPQPVAENHPRRKVR
jgi:putative transposase